MDELELAIKNIRLTAVGPDQIHPEMLRHLDTSAKEFLLLIFQYAWTNHTFPSEWRHAITIPILKEGKNSLKVDTGPFH